MIRIASMLVFVMFVGCAPSQQPIKVAKGEPTLAAIARVAKSLPADQADEFTTAAEVLSLHAALKSTTTDPVARSRATAKAIDGKTPGQVIAEYNRLSPDVQQQLAGEILADKLRDRAGK